MNFKSGQLVSINHALRSMKEASEQLDFIRDHRSDMDEEVVAKMIARVLRTSIIELNGVREEWGCDSMLHEAET
jgi:hypothetical protein